MREEQRGCARWPRWCSTDVLLGRWAAVALLVGAAACGGDLADEMEATQSPLRIKEPLWSPTMRRPVGLDRLVPVNPPAGATCPGASSLRILTYNTQFLSWQVTHRPAYLDSKRAHELAKAIVRADADIVVLNEVFDEDARQQLRDTLRVRGYPHYIYRIGGDKNLIEKALNPFELIATAGTLLESLLSDKDLLEKLVDAAGPLKAYLHEDSGLMVFSRYPFATFKVPPKQTCNGSSCAIECYNNGAYCQVGFTSFKQCSIGTWDCMADKGVGLVKVHIPCAGRHVNIAFTHMQATDKYYALAKYPPSKARAMQLAQIASDLQHAFGPLNSLGEELYVLGDLNINGSSGNSLEWQQHFQNPFSAFTKDIRDGWYYETIKDDVGQTCGGAMFPHFVDSSGDPDATAGERLDYVLRNKTNTDHGDCLQHIHRAWKLRDLDDPSINLSDHHGVLADFGRKTPHCSPKQAEVLPDPTHYANTHGKDLVRNDVLSHAGSMHWYKLEHGGSYSLKVRPTAGGSGAKVAFEIYRPEDLGDPLNSYYGLTNDWGTEFLLEKPPFYIRVFSPDRVGSINYRLSIHAHRGKSQQDAILTLPYASQTASLPTTTIGSSSNETWFKFVTFEALNNLPGEQGKSDKYPHLTFLSQGSAFPFELVETNGQHHAAIGVRASRKVTDPAHAGYSHVVESDRLGQGVHYLRVLPTPAAKPGQAFTVQWRTTLTAFFPVTFKCDDATDTLDEDEVFYELSVDRFRMWQDPHAKHLCDVDTGGYCDAKKIGVFKFVRTLSLQFAEDDTDYNNNDDWFPEWMVDLQKTKPPLQGAESLQPRSFSNGDGTYSISYMMSHSCRADSKSIGGFCALN